MVRSWKRSLKNGLKMLKTKIALNISNYRVVYKSPYFNTGKMVLLIFNLNITGKYKKKS